MHVRAAIPEELPGLSYFSKLWNVKTGKRAFGLGLKQRYIPNKCLNDCSTEKEKVLHNQPHYVSLLAAIEIPSPHVPVPLCLTHTPCLHLPARTLFGFLPEPLLPE